MIIGLSGYARSGKNEVANILVNEFEFEQRAFADKLREALYALNPMCGRDSDYSDRPVIYVQDVIDEFGWDGVKETVHSYEIRRLLQRMGTEMGREVLGDTTWVDAATQNLPERLVFTDCRFPNEAEKVKSLGGVVIRVKRKGVDALNDHASEVSLDKWPFDYTVRNDGDLVDLKVVVSALASSLLV